MKQFELLDLPLPERFKLLNRVAVPRPIALVSTLSETGVGNLAPFSYFNIGGSNPPSCVICPINTRDGVPKDTLVNIEAAGEYVINVVTRSMAEKVNQTSFAYPPDVDELGQVGFTALPGTVVSAPRVAESPVHLECRLFEIVRHGQGALASNYVIGEVLRVHVSESVLTEGRPDNRKLEALSRLGDDFYSSTPTEVLFRLPRPAIP